MSLELKFQQEQKKKRILKFTYIHVVTFKYGQRFRRELFTLIINFIIQADLYQKSREKWIYVCVELTVNVVCKCQEKQPNNVLEGQINVRIPSSSFK